MAWKLKVQPNFQYLGSLIYSFGAEGRWYVCKQGLPL